MALKEELTGRGFVEKITNPINLIVSEELQSNFF